MDTIIGPFIYLFSGPGRPGPIDKDKSDITTSMASIAWHPPVGLVNGYNGTLLIGEDIVGSFDKWKHTKMTFFKLSPGEQYVFSITAESGNMYSKPYTETFTTPITGMDVYLPDWTQLSCKLFPIRALFLLNLIINMIFLILLRPNITACDTLCI